MDLRRQAQIVGVAPWRLIASLLLVIDAGRTRKASAEPRRVALAKSVARVVGATLDTLSQRGHRDYVYCDYYGAYGAEAAARRGPKAASVSGPLADKRC